MKLHIFVGKCLPVLYHFAVGAFIIFGLVTDPSNVAAYVYSTLSLIEHTGWIIIHAVFFRKENHLPAVFFLIHLLVNVGFSSLMGYECFAAYAGSNIFEYVGTYGFGEWLRTLPRIFQLMYFNIWLAIFSTSTGIFYSYCLFSGCVQKTDVWYTKQKPEPTPAPLVAISTISPIS
ncbi:hypothetical protein BDR26DRAFT_214652 [Obelidium mucronatum]|nr:hypothetical protein BDR26DRAFT_214652 [Obelidium mucronatum]